MNIEFSNFAKNLTRLRNDTHQILSNNVLELFRSSDFNSFSLYNLDKVSNHKDQIFKLRIQMDETRQIIKFVLFK